MSVMAGKLGHFIRISGKSLCLPGIILALKQITDSQPYFVPQVYYNVFQSSQGSQELWPGVE